MANETVQQEPQTWEAAEALRMKCIEAEHQALKLGEHEGSLRNKLAQILCVGRSVTQHEGGDMRAERALLRFAGATMKAVGIAIAHEKMVEDAHDMELDADEVSAVLLGMSELLAAAPRLIDAFAVAGIDLRSNGESENREGDLDEDTEVGS